MKREILKIMTVLTTLAVTLAGCVKPIEDIGVSWDQLSSAPKVDIHKKNLPEWLTVRINDYYETWPSSVYKVLIYRGEWNKQNVYFIVNMYSSCLCDFFTNDGEQIVENLSDCRATSKNWVLIYEYGDFVLDLDTLFSN